MLTLSVTRAPLPSRWKGSVHSRVWIDQYLVIREKCDHRFVYL